MDHSMSLVAGAEMRLRLLRNETLFAKATVRCIPSRKFRPMKWRCHLAPQAALESIGVALISLFAEKFLTRYSVAASSE
jgi:hypothetical protein